MSLALKPSRSAIQAPRWGSCGQGGTMQNFQAQHGLLVSWGGFRGSVDKEKAAQFFRVRLWDRDDLIEQLLEQYDRLDDELRAELPLKRMWTVSLGDGLDGGD